LRALVSTAPLRTADWLGQLSFDPPLLDSSLCTDAVAALEDYGITDVCAPLEDPMIGLDGVDPMDAEELSGAEPVAVVILSGPVRFDAERLLVTFNASGADCAVALLPRGRRSSLPRVATDPSGRPELLQPAGAASPVTNLRDTGVRIARAGVAAEVLAAGLDAVTAPSVAQTATDTRSCSWQRDLLTPESFLLCCYELLTGRAGWFGPCGTAPGSVIHPAVDCDPSCCGNVWLAEGVSVGKDTTLRRSVLLPGASVGSGCRLDSCLLLPGASVADGTDMSGKYLDVIGTEGVPSNG
jgi:hypothetical protein